MTATLRTPVAFIIFNRPEPTARVFAEIAKARPSKLLIVADGPRADIRGEAENCAATRAVVDRVDWDCKVLTNFSEINLGCKHRLSSGLDWVFSQVEEAIILEDDCLPHSSFFPFCQELLERYRDDQSVIAISGDNFHAGRKYTRYSYFFSRYPHIWGWASWRRAWQHYDVAMADWASLRETNWLDELLANKTDALYWRNVFNTVWLDRIDTWDYQWLFRCWARNGLSITPEINLVSNIGFGANSTHTGTNDTRMANLPVGEMQFPLSHPPAVLRQPEADEFESKNIFRSRGAGFYARARRKLSALMPVSGSQRG